MGKFGSCALLPLPIRVRWFHPPPKLRNQYLQCIPNTTPLFFGLHSPTGTDIRSCPSGVRLLPETKIGGIWDLVSLILEHELTSQQPSTFASKELGLIMKGFLTTIWALVSVAVALDQHSLGSDVRPNIVFILTDDQDLHLGSLDYMPLLHKHVASQGTFSRRHYCSTAVCCPSRVSLWTGKYAHNTNVTDVFPPYGQ